MIMANKVIITGSFGLIGFETVNFFLKKGYKVIGLDNNIRSKLFSIKTNYEKKREYLKKTYKNNYTHYEYDIRDHKKLIALFKKLNKNIGLIVHAAAQTSHDWSAKDPIKDFSINALATLDLLELYRKYCPKAVFIFTSTNKVYGDSVNSLNYIEEKERFDLDRKSSEFNGISETFSIDHSKHSPFGVSKASADLYVQEYGRYYNLKTGVFRLGVVSGSSQNGAVEQGFLSYMIKSLIHTNQFTIIGYKGKQVRDIIDARDVANAFYLFFKKPKKGGVFNMGGGRKNSFSLLELIRKIGEINRAKPKIKYQNRVRQGDHKWWITDFSKFADAYPSWHVKYSVEDIILDIYKNGL